MKTRITWPMDPVTGAGAYILHTGDLYPGPDRQHLVQVALISAPPLWDDAAIFADTIVAAQAVALLLCELPDVAQDLCYSCHPDRARPNRPRWNIYRGEEPPVIVPCILAEWF